MFYIKLNFQDIEISSIEKEDLNNTYKWFANEEIFMSRMCPKCIDEKQFYERFLEYYFSECEFFLKIKKQGKIIGILKGRIEFKNPNRVWIGYIMLDHTIRGKGMGSKILHKLVDYFILECGIYDFYIKVSQENLKFISFFRKNRFNVSTFIQNLDEKFYDKVILLKKVYS